MRKIIVLILMISTTGCAHLNNEFDCPASKGMGCKRLSTINEEYNTKYGINNINSNRAIYVKPDYYDIYFRGYEDEAGIYHHPRKVTVKA